MNSEEKWKQAQVKMYIAVEQQVGSYLVGCHSHVKHKPGLFLTYTLTIVTNYL